ncbi:Gfo/Idh/MocA family protein [Ruegeria sp. HKCCD8929]|uniref:Gfo/Idh/MocA family protein n=1 Tax=Ruegeria sp. HKCCD8929 TaxID=2683006 RepID=UPI0014893CA5|nr:Gfo/Idh/MocA family oxidoreductase [Ruegeria sp. HKCCD8929]
MVGNRGEIALSVVKWGILGAANFAKIRMGPAIHVAKNAELVAIASGSLGAASDFLPSCPGLRLHSSYEALLNDPGIDAVYIPLPNDLHVPWTLKALDAGKHVLCEKPIALKEADYETLIARRDAAGKLAAEAFMILHHPQWHRVKTLILDGAIGELRHIGGCFTYNNEGGKPGFRDKEAHGGGGVRDIGVYLFGAARFVTDAEPQGLRAELRFEGEVDTFANVTASFGDVTFNAMTATRLASKQDMVFHGSRGHIYLPAPFNPGTHAEGQIHVVGNNGNWIVERFPDINQYSLQVENFGVAMKDPSSFVCPLEFSRGTTVMVNAVLRR